MKKGNVIDLEMFRNEPASSAESQHPVSDELQTAIQHLIYRLRELGPIQTDELEPDPFTPPKFGTGR